MEWEKNNDQLAVFCRLFHVYYEKLHRYAFTILHDNDEANDIVQTVFINLWEKRDKLLMEEAIGSYLYKSTYNRCLNNIRDSKTRNQRIKDVARKINPITNNAKDKLLVTELSRQIQKVLEELPPQCKIIFIKSRMEDKKYAEIAIELNISIKTVEAQIGKALRIFRQKLRDYL